MKPFAMAYVAVVLVVMALIVFGYLVEVCRDQWRKVMRNRMIERLDIHTRSGIKLH